jgi:SPP1 gp7 family putative phage head morphogenesis protein
MPEPSPVLQALDAYRRQLDALDAQALNRLVANYSRSWARLDGMLSALLLEIGDRPPTAGQLARLERYTSLLEQITIELTGLQTLTANEVAAAGELGVSLGAQHARELISTTVAGDASIAGVFNVLPREAITALLGFLAPDGPLYARLQLLAPYTAQAVADALVEGITLGFNPRKIARMVQDAFGRGLTDALRFVRTANLWAYREANRATMAANGDVVTGWQWVAALDDRVCGACLSLHGSVYPISEPLAGHHNCRCTAAPIARGYGQPVEEDGPTWFERQPEAAQRRLLGPGKYDAWRAGQFQLSDLPGEHVDSVYGPMTVERALKDLLSAAELST